MKYIILFLIFLIYQFSILYPTPHTVFINFGFFESSFNFSLILLMCTITVLLLSKYFSFHTFSKSSSELTTLPLFVARYNNMSNSIGVRSTSFSYNKHLCFCLSICNPFISIISLDLSLKLYNVYLLNADFTLAINSSGLNGFVI